MEVILKLTIGVWSHVPFSSKALTNLGEVLTRLLPYYAYLVNTKGNHKKVFSSTCRQLLLPALSLKDLLTKEARNVGVEERSQRLGKGWNTEVLLEGLDGVVLSLFSR